MPRAADSLVLGALGELADDSSAAPSGARGRGLSRALDAVVALRQAQGLQRWCSFVAVSEATQPLEDDLITTQRALRRAHASLTASIQQQANAQRTSSRG